MSSAKRKPSAKKIPFALSFGSTLSEVFQKYEVMFDERNVTTIDVDMDTLSYQDEAKKPHKCILSRIDFNNGSAEYCCFWDRHPFTTAPLGCPVKYVPQIISREYHSEITREKFKVKESLCKLSVPPAEIPIQKESEDYFETDGVFCSFNCMLSFILDNKHNPLYQNSIVLMQKMHTVMCGSPFRGVPAGHWRVLKPYGGFVDITKYREGFAKIDFECRGISRPNFVSISSVFEEKIKF